VSSSDIDDESQDDGASQSSSDDSPDENEEEDHDSQEEKKDAPPDKEIPKPKAVTEEQKFIADQLAMHKNWLGGSKEALTEADIRLSLVMQPTKYEIIYTIKSPLSTNQLN